MIKNILKILSGSFISRVFGFIREYVVATSFGTSRIADAYAFALLFPNLFRQILGEDMVERALIPPFKTIYDRGEIKSSWKFISAVFNWFFLLLMAALFLLYAIVPLLFHLRESYPQKLSFIFKNTDFNYDLALNLILIMLPFMVLIGLAAFLGGILNFFAKNWIFGLAPFMLSLGIIASIYLWQDSLGGYSMAIGWLLGGFLQFMIQLIYIFCSKFKTENKVKYHLTLKTTRPELKLVKKQAGFISLNAIFNKSSEILGHFLALGMNKGALSSLYYARRLYLLPFGIFSLSIARGINPEINRLQALKQYQQMQKMIQKGIEIYLLVILPIVVLTIMGSQELLLIVYGSAKFDFNSVKSTATALNFLIPGLFFLSIYAFYIRILSILGKNSYSLLTSIYGSFVNIISALILIKYFNLEQEGLALSSTIGFAFNAFLIEFYLNQELLKLGMKKVHFYKGVFATWALVISYCLLLIVVIKFQLYSVQAKYSALLSLGTKSLAILLLLGSYLLISGKISYFKKKK